MVNVTCPQCGTTVDIDEGRGFGFCVKCGNRLSTGGSPSSSSSFGCNPGGMARVTVAMPAKPANISGSFSYFGVKWDGRDVISSKLGRIEFIDTRTGRHEIEVRQVNSGLFSSTVIKVSATYDVTSSFKIDVFADGDHLVLSATGGIVTNLGGAGSGPGSSGLSFN